MTHDASQCVLVVDDDADIREMMQTVLELYGYKVVAASDGAEALSKLRQGMRPCLILLDLMMPGMNGPEFRKAQLDDPALASIPVVVLSGDARARERAGSLNADVLAKPIALEALLKIAERFCGAPHDLY